MILVLLRVGLKQYEHSLAGCQDLNDLPIRVVWSPGPQTTSVTSFQSHGQQRRRSVVWNRCVHRATCCPHSLTCLIPNPSPLTALYLLSCSQIAFILESLGDILSLKVRRSDVLSTWTGIRPLASNPKATNTQSIVRDHSE